MVNGTMIGASSARETERQNSWAANATAAVRNMARARVSEIFMGIEYRRKRLTRFRETANKPAG